jgi:hypothetical protein
MEDGQKTPPGHPDFNSYVKILRVFIWNGQMDERMDGEIKVTGTLIFLPSRDNLPQLSDSIFSLDFYHGQSKQFLPLLKRLSQIHPLAKFLL